MLKYSGLLLLVIAAFLSGCSESEEPQSSEELNEVSMKSEDDETLASTADFEKAEIRYEEDTGLFQLEMYMKDQNMMEEIFEERVGQTIHFYYGDELISSPDIMVSIRGESFTLAGDFEEETAEQIVDTIKQQTDSEGTAE